MSNENLLADLGLDLGTNTAAAKEVATEAAAGAEAAEKAKRSQIDVGTIVVSEEAEDLPVMVRNFTGERKTGSKYKFADIAAPVLKDAADPTKGWSYFNMKVAVGENDPDAFRRSIQSATTQANNAYKPAEGTVGAEGYKEAGAHWVAGEVERKFVTRSFNDAAGKFAGMKVFRVDDTLAAE